MDKNLVPITKVKKSKENWLNTSIKYENELIIKDLVEDMSYKSYIWINNKNDLENIQDYDSFKNQFINFLYDKYYKE